MDPAPPPPSPAPADLPNPFVNPYRWDAYARAPGAPTPVQERGVVVDVTPMVRWLKPLTIFLDPSAPSQDLDLLPPFSL